MRTTEIFPCFQKPTTSEVTYNNNNQQDRVIPYHKVLHLSKTDFRFYFIKESRYTDLKYKQLNLPALAKLQLGILLKYLFLTLPDPES